MDYINKNLDRYNKIYWATKPDNIASQKLAKKCGFSIVRDDKQWKTYALDCHKIITDEFNMNEAYIFNEDNIYYNKDKFDSGEINLCFITGHSGSGKSTMALNNAKADISDNTDWVSLDDVIFNKECHTLDEFKSNCRITYDFFITVGKKFWCDREEALAYKGNYEDDIVRSFVEFAKTYANSHKNKKFIIEGVWLFHVFNPEELKDYAVYILGTSMIISKIRGAKRDSADAKNKITRAKAFASNSLFKNWKWYFIDEKKIAKYRDYYKKLTKEVLNETKRSELPDSSFGIPEDRKFPLDTEKHVRSAIHLFGHAEESKKKSLARRIYNAAKKYSIEIPKTTQCYKYLNEGVIEGLIPSGKDTIIFDMGSVLVNANTKEVLYNNPHIPNEYVEEIYEALRNNLFYIDDINLAKEIQQYDVSKAKKYLEDKTPDYINPYIDYVFDTFNKAMYTYPYVDSLLSTLRRNGYNIYFLSNWTRFSYIQEEQFFRALLEKYFDGGLFSFQTKHMKPEKEFFDILISKFHLDPSRCVFFDDNMENVIAGNSVGIYSVQFDKENTPKEILYSINNLNMNNEKTGEELLLSTDAGMTKINSSEITWWYLDKERLSSNTTKEEEQFYKTLDDAVKYYSEYYDITEPTELYVYTNAYNFSKSNVTPIVLCSIGKISINENGDYEWLIHYPLHLNDNKLESLKEFMALNAINPIVGIRKPYVAVVQRYSTHKPELMFSNDIEGNNYLAVDDKNKFEIVTDSEIESINEVYKFIGNKAYVYRLEDRYTNKDYISEKGIYGELTDKNLLSIDQLKFDESFEYIDFDLLEQKAITEASTIRRNIRGLLELNVYDHELIKSYKTEIPKFYAKYNKDGNIKIMEDFDGCYFFNTLNKKRSGSVPTTKFLTENMLKSVL